MDTHFLEPLTEDEMYAIEFHDCELHEDEPEEEAENGYHCPVCHATELQYAMHYRVSDDDETQELYRCARCGATGEADDCRVELVLRRRNPSRFTNRRKNNKENNNDEWNSTIQHQLPSRGSPPLGRRKTRRRTLWRTGYVLTRRRSGHVRVAGGGTTDSRTWNPGARDL